MKSVTDAHRRVDLASGLAEVLDAAYDAFEYMLTAIYGYHDSGGLFYPALIMAAASAANGRDAVAFAPSFQPSSRPVLTAAVPASDLPAWQDLGASVAALGSSLSARLQDVAAAAQAADDRCACLDAARCAEEVHGLAAASLQ